MNTTDSLIKKYKKAKGDVLDNWQECKEDAHKTMWEAYNLAYGQILFDLHNLKEYIPEAAQPVVSEESMDIAREAMAAGIDIGMAAQKELSEKKAQPVHTSHSDKDVEVPDAPESPVHLSNSEGMCWQYGWEAGYKSAQSSPVQTEDTVSDKIPSDADIHAEAYDTMPGFYKFRNDYERERFLDGAKWVKSFFAKKSSPVEAVQEKDNIWKPLPSVNNASVREKKINVTQYGLIQLGNEGFEKYLKSTKSVTSTEAAQPQQPKEEKETKNKIAAYVKLRMDLLPNNATPSQRAGYDAYLNILNYINNIEEQPSGKGWNDIFLEYSKACSLELEAVKYIIPLKDWLNKNYPMK